MSPQPKQRPHQTLEERLGFQRKRYGVDWSTVTGNPEILDDYLAVRLLLERLRSARSRDGNTSTVIADHLELARVCLDRVEIAPTLEEKWSCINKANALLVFACVNRDEQAAVMLRLKNLFPLLRGFKDRLPDPFKEFGPTDDEVKSFDPAWAYEVLETAGQGWHFVNEQNAFSTRFWQHARNFVALMLVLAVVGTELSVSGRRLPGSWQAIWNAVTTPSSWTGITTLHYVWAALFGALGGAISSLLGSRSLFVSATTYRVSRSQAWMRILLGGVGAYIVVLAIQSDLIFAAKYRDVLAEFTGLAIVAIASGFSERLFVSALERIGGTIAESQGSGAGNSGGIGGGGGGGGSPGLGAAGAALPQTVNIDALLAAFDQDDHSKQIDVMDRQAQSSAQETQTAANELLRDLDHDDHALQIDEADKGAQR